MKQDNRDVVLKVITEWTQYETIMNWDVGCDEIIRQLTCILKGMTFSTQNITLALREVADEIDEDMELYNDKNERLDYGTTN